MISSSLGHVQLHWERFLHNPTHQIYMHHFFKIEQGLSHKVHVWGVQKSCLTLQLETYFYLILSKKMHFSEPSEIKFSDP